MSIDQIMSKLDEIEASVEKNSLSKNELKNLGDQQRELANKLRQLETRGGSNAVVDWGTKMTEDPSYKAFIANGRSDCNIQVKNSITNTVGNTLAQPLIGVTPGAFLPMTREGIFPSTPTDANAVDGVRENVFTNSAAETAEGSDSAESSITFTTINTPIRSVSHWIKVSRQLADDAPALAAYVNTRMAHGVNRRIETQLATGNGTAPNLSGIFKSGNYTNHGYTDANLGSVLKKHVLIRKTIADLVTSGYTPTAILLNPIDWMSFEIDMLTNNPTIASVADLSNGIPPRLFGVPVVQSSAITADTFAVGAFNLVGTIYNRSDVNISLSYSDDDNFTKQLVTVMAERRLALHIDAPQAIRAGDLTPA